ncbi:hypothetical protein DL95DRAFT_468689 [Leptodontidium sp. 2 PMI_412]|nr:hypothetical protein DL95DRAFT_468689 [Leptodontidium sp. 2 PMI_412]
MSNHFGGSGFQPNSGIGRDPNNEIHLECTTSAEIYQPGVYGTFLSENDLALFNGVPHGPSMRSTTAVDPSLPDQFRFMEAWQQDELMGTSYSNSIIGASNWSLQLCPEIYQHEPHVGSGGHEHHHLHPNVISQPDDTYPAGNYGIALLLGGVVNDGTVMQQQPPFPALHQDTFAPPATVHHQERQDHDTFYQMTSRWPTVLLFLISVTKAS